MSRLVLIVNPAAARGRASGTVRDASAVLREAGVEHEVRVSASLPHARELATEAAEAGDVVVAVGGDGTVGALAGATAVAGGVFGVIPGARWRRIVAMKLIAPPVVEIVRKISDSA